MLCAQQTFYQNLILIVTDFILNILRWFVFQNLKYYTVIQKYYTVADIYLFYLAF
jgi:hypothetical protein